MRQCLVIIFAWISYVTLAQQTVNPGRPSYSENNHLVHSRYLQTEKGLSFNESSNENAYGGCLLLRTGIARRWEGRTFFTSAFSKAKVEDGFGYRNLNALGAGLKYQVMVHDDNSAGLSLLLQASSDRMTTCALLYTLQLNAISMDLNIQGVFDQDNLMEMGYILCLTYPFDKTSFFLEGMFTEDLSDVDNNLWIHAGVCRLVNSYLQLDVSASTSGFHLANQAVQMGVSVLIPFKKNR